MPSMPRTQKQDLSDNDAAVKLAYGAAAKSAETLWLKFARVEVDALLAHVGVEPGIRVLDIGCGVGRHGLELAARGFSVRALDFSEGCVERTREEHAARSDEIAEAGGKFEVELGDARQPLLGETAHLVLCLYDVLGSSPARHDAERLVGSLFQSCRPDGIVVLGCMSGTQSLRALSSMRLVSTRPSAADLEPISITQRCREAFDFAKMAYNPATGTLYHRERVEVNGIVVVDKVVEERRYLPAEVCDLLEAAGFTEVRHVSVRAGKWDFAAPFDPDAPEILYVARRPGEVVPSIPHRPPWATDFKRTRGYTIDLIPKDEIQPTHASIVSRIFCTSFGKNPNTGKMHVLGARR